MIQRTLVKTIKETQKNGFITVIYGPRRVGKTTLLSQLTKDVAPTKILKLNGDTSESRSALGTTSEVKLRKLVENSDYILVDEAQRIPDIGLALKIIIDMFPQKVIYVTGSSSLGLAQGIKEPLTGRHFTYQLYPLSTKELAHDVAPHQIPSLLHEQLIHGGYPQLIEFPQASDKQQYLHGIINDYLFKDVRDLSQVDQPENLEKLAKLLAFQLGNEVSLNELAGKLSVDVKTVQRYLRLLKQSFVIIELGSFSRNLRKELAKSKKYYFWDLGIRNTLINQFHDLDVRPDTGALWENFLILERLKKQTYQRDLTSNYFWRTYDQKELDWVEEKENVLTGYEFKWGNKIPKIPTDWADAYPNAKYQLINQENYLEFIL